MRRFVGGIEPHHAAPTQDRQIEKTTSHRSDVTSFDVQSAFSEDAKLVVNCSFDKEPLSEKN